jgi:cadmium resistance protein CadD (predicted permease)
MSFREKSAWVSLVTYLGAYGYYFWTIASAVATGQSDTLPSGRLLVNVICLLIVIEVVLQVTVALWKPTEAQAPRDEREKLIALKSTRWAFYVVMAGAATGAGTVALGVPAFYTANGIFLAVVLAEVVRFAGQVMYFRIGA